MTPGDIISEDVASAAVSAAMSSAKTLGCREVEAFVCLTNTKAMSIDQNNSVLGSVHRDSQVFIRLVDKGRMGVAFTNSLKKNDLRRCVGDARRLAKVSEADPRWTGFAEAGRKYPTVRGLCDPRIISLPFKDLKERARMVVDAALAEAVGITVTECHLETVTRAIAVGSTAGTEASFRDAYISAMCGTVMGRGANISPDCLDGHVSREDDVDFVGLGSSCGSIARDCAVSAEPRTEECQVVFSPGSLGIPNNGLLNIILSKALSGEGAIQGTTFLADHVGDRIGPKSMTIVDDPLRTGTVGSRPLDDEGLPTRRTDFVREGVFEGFVWNSYHGSVSGKKSTGNAVRDLSTGYVTSAPLNMCMEPGRATMRDLVSEVDHGYLVWGCQGAHTSNVETGDFSFVASPGFLIERGAIVGCVRGAMISGNIMDLFSGIEKIGGDTMDCGNATQPSMLVGGVKITTG